MREEPSVEQPTAAALGWRTFVRQALSLAGGAVIAHVLTLAVMPVLSRLYGPEEFGALGLFLSFVFFAAPLAAWRFDVAVVSAENDSDAAGLIALGMILTLPTALAAWGLLWLLRGYGWFGFGELSMPLTLLVFPTILSGAGLLILRQWCVRRQLTGAINAGVWGQAAARSVLQIAAGLLGGAWGLAAGELFGRVAGMGPLVREVHVELAPRWRGLTWATLRRLAHRYNHYPRFGTLSTFINSLAAASAVPLMIWAFGPVEGGVFALVQRIMALPVALLGRGVSDAFHGALARSAADRPAALELLGRAARGMAALCILPATAFMLIAPRGLPFVLGPSWEVSGRLAAAMVPWIFGQMVVSPLGQAAAVFAGYRLKLLYDGLSLAAIVSVVTLASAAEWPLIPTVGLLSWLQLGNYGVYYLVLRRVVGHAALASEVHSPAAPEQQETRRAA